MSAMDELRALAAHGADTPARAQGIEDFFRARLTFFTQQAGTICRQYRLDVDRHHDDVLSLVMEAGLSLVTDLLADPEGKLQAVRSFEAYLSTYTRAAMKAYTGSTAMMAASGMQSVSRRRIRYEKKKAELEQSLGREPEVSEVIEFANADAYETRANPAKQGILLTADDARPVHSADLMAAETIPTEAPAIIHPLEGKQMVEDIIDRAIEEDPFLGQVAAVWIGAFYDDGGHDVIPLAEVAKTLGVTRKVVREAIEELRVIGVEIVNEYLETENIEVG